MSSLVGLSRRSLLLSQNLIKTQRNFSAFNKFNNLNNVPKKYGKYLWMICGGAVTVATFHLIKQKNTVQALNIKKFKRDEEKAIKLTQRERRFIKFASVEFDGQLYMTPQDFLDSVVEQEPRPRLKRRTLTPQEVNKIKDDTPALKKGSTKLFRSMRDRGIISYTEYLFLLSILTKPTSGFRIAFNMFDLDGNQRVDKTEFLVIRKILSGSFKEHDLDDESRRVLLRLISTEEQAEHLRKKKSKMDKCDDKHNDEKKREEKVEVKVKEEKSRSFMERIFSGAWRDKRGQGDEKQANSKAEEDAYIDDEEGLQRKHKVDTTLQVHFFGKKGNQALHYEGFYKFMDNLQTEVLELEFIEFSKGNISISEVDFAKILLRYTYLDTEEYDMFLERLLERVKEESGITFEEFRDFCRFLNNLEDFAIAMRMYTLAEHAISKEEFSRAVKICTGYTLSQHLIDTVFAIFDVDGDGLLSYKEFIYIMKDRLHRGFRVSYKPWSYEDLVYPEYEDLEYPLFFAWRRRFCRGIENYINTDDVFF